jgi:hypothetical protein
MREGIATYQSGIRYRSRLEARWAAFFDLIGWRAFYEPFDLDGYIPDFILHGHSERILVEVKPVADKDDPLFKATTAKIEKSGWPHEALIVSYFLPESKVWSVPCVGWLSERVGDATFNDKYTVKDIEIKLWWELAPFHDGDGLGFGHEYGSYHNRITGGNNKGIGSSDPKIERYWREAGNAVQWRAP